MTPTRIFGNANIMVSYETQTVYMLRGLFFGIYTKYHVPQAAAKYRLNEKLKIQLKTEELGIFGEGLFGVLFHGFVFGFLEATSCWCQWKLWVFHN